MEETVAVLKSCVISKKGGIPIEMLNHEFEKLVGEPIPYLRLGFASLYEFLQQVNGLKITHNEFGESIFVVDDPKVYHIERLIERQRSNYIRTKNKQYKRFNMYADSPVHTERRNKRTRYETNSRPSSRSSASSDPCCCSHCHDHGNFMNSNAFHNESDEVNYEAVVLESHSDKITDIVTEPIVAGHQLIGDDFFLQLTIRNLGLPIWRRTGSMALHCGLCVSGQTIKDCIKNLRNVQCLSNRVIVLLGSTDVYNGATYEEMVHDMSELLRVLSEDFSFSTSAVTLCTIPPLANLSIVTDRHKIRSLYTFNNWIRSLRSHDITGLDWKNDYVKGHPVIDLFENFADENYCTIYDYFQMDARMVSGCKHPYVLWNKRGRKLAMATIRKG